MTPTPEQIAAKLTEALVGADDIIRRIVAQAIATKVNDKGGRDHWGRAGSLIFAGAGVRRGMVIGSTDKNGAFVTDRPVRPADVAWTIYEALGIDPASEIVTPEGRPVSILAEGASVQELFS